LAIKLSLPLYGGPGGVPVTFLSNDSQPLERQASGFWLQEILQSLCLMQRIP
jgi:hypothetical protein